MLRLCLRLLLPLLGHSLCFRQLLPQLLLAGQVLQTGVLHTGRHSQSVRAATAVDSSSRHRVAMTAAAVSTVRASMHLGLPDPHITLIFTCSIRYSRLTHCGAHSGQLRPLQQPVMWKEPTQVCQWCCRKPGARQSCFD
jgi:hypothetical protein